MLMRMIDFLKGQQITAVLTSLTHGGDALEQTELGVSSLVDTWLLLRDIELGGERNRGMYVLKSRGMAHSNKVREFMLTSAGFQLVEVYLGPDGVLTGSMREAQQAREQLAADQRRQEIERRERELKRKRQILAAQTAIQEAELDAEREELNLLVAAEAMSH